MPAKPDYLGRYFGDAFQDGDVAAAYQYRAPYPAATFALLAGLMRDEPRAALDVGCGRGEIARNLLPYISRVDALDPSAAMIAAGRAEPGGDDPRLRWIVGYAEDAPLAPPYALITAGQSLHWMDWDVVLPRFATALTPHGKLAIVTTDETPPPWADELRHLIARYSTNQAYQPVDLIGELAARGLFVREGEARTPPEPFARTVETYVASFHSMSSLSRERMGAEAATAFDRELRALVAPFATEGADGALRLEVAGWVVWGRALTST